MVIEFIVIAVFLYIFYHIIVYLTMFNKQECTTIYKEDVKEKEYNKKLNKIYDQGVLDEFYNLIRINYLRNIEDCIDNNMGPSCNMSNITQSDWNNIQYYIQNNDIDGGFENEIMDAYRYRLDKCLNDPNVVCQEEEVNRIKDILPLKDVLDAFRYRYVSCLAESSDIVCPEEEITYLENYIDEN